ncbi:nitroreductase family protein [Chloroflexota bacterium]
MVNIPFSKWYKVIESRRSRRKFESKPLKPKILNQIRAICRTFQQFPDARAVLVTKSPDKVFKGAIGSYGKIKGATAFVAFIGDMKSRSVHEHVGYTGEGIILEAEAMGLNTCWVGGFFKPKVVESLIAIGKDERVLAVTPVGFAPERLSFEERVLAGFGLTYRRKPLSKLVIGLRQSEWPEWMKLALEAARLAPSRANRQPWRFHVEKESIAVATNSASMEIKAVTSERLCCGIAMLHIELAALHCGISGSWSYFNPPLVAKFEV